MITPTMEPLEAAQDARQDLLAIVHKVTPISKKQEHKCKAPQEQVRLLTEQPPKLGKHEKEQVH